MLILDSPICFEECENVLKEMRNGKSPGSDGITAEFYKQYWPVIGSQFLEVINEIYSTNSLCDTQKRGVLTHLTVAFITLFTMARYAIHVPPLPSPFPRSNLRSRTCSCLLVQSRIRVTYTAVQLYCSLSLLQLYLCFNTE